MAPTLARLTLLTRERALRDGYLPHEEALFLGLMQGDDGTDLPPVGFVSLSSVMIFLREMTPPALSILGTPGETDHVALIEAIVRDGTSVH